MKINPEGRIKGRDLSLRKRISLTSQGYASNTTIHGISYLFESRRGVESFLWFLIVVAAMMFTILQTTTLYTDWQNEPVITNLDTIAMPIKDIEFPAVTICPQGAINSALDAVLFKQLKEYIGNKSLETSKRKKRSTSVNNDITITEDLLRKFLEEKYPGAKKKPTKLVKVMTSDDPASTLENEAVLLPDLDDDECGKSSVDDYIKGIQEMKTGACPDGFSMFTDLFCFKTSPSPMNYEAATDYCNSQSGSSLPYLESKMDIDNLQTLVNSVVTDADDEVQGEMEGYDVDKDPPLWNGVPMDKTNDTVLPFEDLPPNIQRRLPMYGTIDVLPGPVLTLKRNMTAYMIRHKKHDGNEFSDGWQPIRKASIKIFAKLMEIGTHNVDGDAEMYLLTDVQYASACSERSDVKCGGKRFNTNKPNTTSEEACQMICDAADKCNYFFWSIDNWCAMFETCDQLKRNQNPENPGTIYAKKGLCSDRTKEQWPQMKCSNGIKNQEESGVDCGGPCKPCEAKSYWIHERTSVIDKFDSVAVSNQVNADGKICLAIENTADDSTHFEINSSDCTQERSVMCQLNVPKALENTAPKIPPTFPCIGSNQMVTIKSKREVEYVNQGRHDKPKDGKDPCASVDVLNTNHPANGDNGKYFYFDKSEFTKMIGKADWNEKRYDVVQRGSKTWTGKVVVWDGTTGQYAGSGRYSGRRDSGAVDGNWAAGDTIQLKACVEQDPPMWNDEPMNKEKATPLPSTELPFNIERGLPMYGTTNVQHGDKFTLKRNMTAYIIIAASIAKDRRNGLLDGWTRIQLGGKWIFGKIMEEGTYEVDGDALMYLFNDVQYASACSERSNVQCLEKGGRFNSHKPGTMSEEACQIICDADDRCNFFFWSIDNSCSLFKTCDRFKKNTYPGTNYAKNGLCSDILKEEWQLMKCSDGIKNRDETGVDCGGPCKPCDPIENPTVNCSAGARGTGGICDCSNAIGWIEGQWWKPWCNEGLCNTGQDYKGCIGKADGHKLSDDTWCWKEGRNTQCQTKPENGGENEEDPENKVESEEDDDPIPENIKKLEVSIDPTKVEERLVKKRKAVQDYEENFGSLDFEKSYSSLFELLWYGQLPCTDVKGITSEIKNEMAFIKRCYWKGQKLSCNSIFRKQPTEQGMCCSFNMKKAEEMLRYSRYKESITTRQSEETQMSFEEGEKPEWYKKGREPKSEAGVKKGLTIVFDGHSDKLSMGSVSNRFYGFKVVVDQKDKFPLVSKHSLIARPGHENNIKIDAIYLEGKDEIRKYDSDRRQCYFPDEFELQTHTYYSQPNCIFECKTQFASKCLTTCNEVGQECDCSQTSDFLDSPINSSDLCTPWFYPAKEEKLQKFCNPWNVKKFQEIMDNQIPQDQCEYCLPDCNTTLYQSSIAYAGLRKCDVNSIGSTSILCDLVDDPLNPAPWSNIAKHEYQESNASVPWFLETFQAGSSSNSSKFSNVRYLGKGMESNALFGSDIKANPTYDAFELDIGIMNVYFGKEMIMKYTKKNRMSTSDFMSQIGGSVGLAMGVSIISVVELIYWLTFKLFGQQNH